MKIANMNFWPDGTNFLKTHETPSKPQYALPPSFLLPRPLLLSYIFFVDLFLRSYNNYPIPSRIFVPLLPLLLVKLLLPKSLKSHGPNVFLL
jgi:hypothetical protein